MRIGFDLRPFLKQETGVGVYFKNLLFELARLDPSNEYFLFSASWKDRFPAAKVPPFEKSHFKDFRWPVRAVNFFWYKLGWPRLDSIFKTSLDITHSPTPIPLPTKGKTVVTVCDLFFMDFPGKADKEARKSFVKRTEASLQKADGIIAISEFTKKALQERFKLDGRKIKVTYLGLNSVYQEAAGCERIGAVRRRFALPEKFLLFVGATEPRKNLLNLLKALSIVHKKHKEMGLAIVGREGADHQRLLEKIRSSGLELRVKILGYLPEEDVRDLYHAATALVYPSLCEGFGLPLLEAMACGLPAAVSGVSALPEIGRDAALYFEPENPDDIAEKVAMIIKNDGLRQALKDKGKKRALDFSWKRTAAETLDFYRSLLEP
jgi:glycosyltransferase involved in cell wall biosynthesis